METFPAFFPLSGQCVAIAGEGPGGDAKARLFAGSPARIVRLTGERAIDPASYEGACLAFVAGVEAAFLDGAARAARAAHVPVNVVDHPELSDFHTPAVIDRGQVVAAIGTAGASPLLASLLRAEIETRIPEHAGALAALLGARREALRAAFPDFARRRAFLRAVLDGPAARAVAAGDLAGAAALLDEALSGGFEALGRVTLIGTGASADLIPLRAARRLGTADFVAAEGGVEAFVAAHCRRDADRLLAGAFGARTLVDLALAGRLVAVVARSVDRRLAGELRRLGATVEVFAPAPAP